MEESTEIRDEERDSCRQKNMKKTYGDVHQTFVLRLTPSELQSVIDAC